MVKTIYWYCKNTKLRTKAKNDFEKYYFKLKEGYALWRNTQNVKKHRNIKLVTRNYLVSELNYQKTMCFFSKFISNRNENNNSNNNNNKNKIKNE